ncbi:MAG: PAS domain S-box protein [Planctomycetota bacterium]|nr:PAS domain S-box protein [Planctomycetota bacterium]
MPGLGERNISSGICHGVRERLLLLDADLYVKAASESYYDGFNVAPGQTLERGLNELGNGQWNIPALLKLLKDLASGDGTFDDFEVQHDFPGVGYKTMLLSGRRLAGDGVTTGEILLGIVDVTDWRRMEAELAQQRMSFETTLSSISDAVIVTDTRTHVTYMNPAAQFLTGWTQQEALGSLLTKVFNIVDEQLRHPVESPVDKAIREGPIVGHANHTVLIAKDGRHFPIDDSAAPIRDKSGTILGAVLVFHDIAQQRRAKQQMEISELRYRRLFEAAHDGILILDAQTAKVLDVNSFLQHLLGYPAEYFLGKELWEIGFFQDADRSKAAMAELQKVGSIRYENLPLPDKAGRHIPVEFVSNVYCEGDHKVIQCNVRDITARKTAQDEIGRMKEAAEAANRAKSEFLANMSHEIRTPMTAILGFAEILLQSNQDPFDRTECIQTVRRNALHLLELVNDILDLSKIEAGKMTVERIHCNLPKLFEDLISLMRPRASEKKLGFEVTFDGPIPRSIKTDPMRLRQILVNLLGNAVKFTDAGKIQMRVRAERSDAANILYVEVIDTGIGVAGAQLDRLFQPFTQAEESTTRKFGGTGLGLAISQRIAHLLGGNIEVKSELGVGTTFTVRIDGGSFANVEMLNNLDESMLPKTNPVEKWEEIPLRGRILLVEDGRDNQRLLSTHLRASGAEVSIAENGQIAVDMVRTNSFDLVLMDMQMPVMDGYSATAELRRQGFTMPIIALTAYAMAEDRKKCALSGCTDYLSKPIDREHLLKTVSEHLGQGTSPAPSDSGIAAAPPAAGDIGTMGSMRSTLAGFPGMAKIIAEFVEGLPEEVRKMNDLLQRNELNALGRVAHQLRGASGGYGFDSITEPATRTEDAIKESKNLQTITENVNLLIRALRQIEGFDTSKEQPLAESKT